jgi:hypothetical protein
MRHAAIIAHDGATLMLPAYSAYELDVVATELAWRAKQHSGVSLRLSEGECSVATIPISPPTRCIGCDTRGATLMFRGPTVTALCPICTRVELSHRVPRWLARGLRAASDEVTSVDRATGS